MLKRLSATAAILIITAAPAFAHLDPAAHGSFMAGLTHPLSGVDHMLAMIAVGLWAAQIGGRARLAIPAAFVALMATGFVLALAGASLPFVEPGILASIVGLGLLVMLAVKTPAAIGAGIVGVFALFHGHAHGGELGAATAMTFGLGFVVATAALHAAGVAIGMMLGGRNPAVTRLLGLATAASGAWLAFG
jgi:urease accessory protein